MSDATPTGAGYIEELRRIVPTEQIDVQDPSEPDRGGSWGVEPATQDELVDVMKWASWRKASVYTRNPRVEDQQASGARPRIYLRGRRMRRVQDVDIVSGTVTVQSGIGMRELQDMLAERRFTTGFPTRPWRDEPLGAVLAASLDSHWGPRYGHMEEHVLGLGLVFPDGTTAYSRLAPRKAVGPDFDRLFLGSRGRFGIILEATLRLYPSTERVVLCYAAQDLRRPLRAIRQGIELGLDPRAIEVLTPSLDRAWGRKRVGLTDDHPVLVIIEPWGPLASLPLAAVDEHFSAHLERLAPPVGWNVHEGLLPPPRAWRAPTVGVPWSVLETLAETLGGDVPPGLWVVRMSRQGGWLSLAEPGPELSEEETRLRAPVEALVAEYLPPEHGAWDPMVAAIKARLDPDDILNPQPRGAS